MEALPGVAHVETRIVEPCMLPLPQLAEPVRGVVVVAVAELLNLLHLRDGRLPEPDHSDEAVLLEAFAEAHHLRPGDRLPVVLNGKKRELQIVGVALSPEYVVPIAPGSLAADPTRFAVLWMGRETLAAAFQKEGAFNDLVAELRPTPRWATSSTPSIASCSATAGWGRTSRDRQPSNLMVTQRLALLKRMSSFLPAIFLAVAALLVNLVLSRLVLLQQPEIAMLKAIGYSNRRWGCTSWSWCWWWRGCGVAAAASMLGRLLGGAMMKLYHQFYRFPISRSASTGATRRLSLAISFWRRRRAPLARCGRPSRLPPAEAMRPPAPARYRPRLSIGCAYRGAGPRRTWWCASWSGGRCARSLRRSPSPPPPPTVIGGWYYDGVEALFDTSFT